MSEASVAQLVVLRDGETLARECMAADENALVAEVARRAQLYPDAWVLAELREGELTYGWCRRPHDGTLFHSVFYNDFDDYEDDILIGDARWLGAVVGVKQGSG